MPYQAYYAVYDGHNGTEAAYYASIHVLPNIVRHPDFNSDLSKAIKEGIKTTDDHFCQRVRKLNSPCRNQMLRLAGLDTKFYVSFLALVWSG